MPSRSGTPLPPIAVDLPWVRSAKPLGRHGLLGFVWPNCCALAGSRRVHFAKKLPPPLSALGLFGRERSSTSIIGTSSGGHHQRAQGRLFVLAKCANPISQDGFCFRRILLHAAALVATSSDRRHVELVYGVITQASREQLFSAHCMRFVRARRSCAHHKTFAILTH